MATIPVNPERRDPGYLRKKADIGLSNVDNISASDFINLVAEDVKKIGNEKILSSDPITSRSKYIGILITSDTSSHVNFTTGLFDASKKELAQFSVDFSFCATKDDTGSTTGTVNYTTQTPELDPYLKSLSLRFTLVGSQIYVYLYTTGSILFNQLGTTLTEWTGGTELCGYEVENIVKTGKDLANVQLDIPRTTSYSAYQESLPVYDKSGSRVLIDTSKTYTQSDLESLNYPTINNVPFIAKKGMNIAGGTNARNITITAKHSGSSLNDAGGHDWEVLNNFRAIRYENPQEHGVTDPDTFDPTTIIVSNTEKSYKNLGLCRPAGYSRFKGEFKTFTEASKTALNWLESIGQEDTDVITVGLLKEYMNFMISQVLQNVKNLDQTESISYSDWTYTLNYPTENLPSSECTSYIDVESERTKTTVTYNSSGEIVDTKTEVESGTSEITVTGFDAESGVKVIAPGKDSVRWTINFPSNTTYFDKTYHLAIYQSNVLVKIVSFYQDSSSETVESEEYEIYAYTDKIVSGNSKNSTANVDYFVRIKKTTESGESYVEYYDGPDATLSTSPETTVTYKGDGLYNVVYPENSSTEEKNFVLTLKYKDKEKQLNVTQTVKTDKAVVIGTNYIFSSDLKTLGFVNNNKSLSVNFTSKSYEQGSLEKGTELTDVSFSVESKPDWVTSNIDIENQTGTFTVEDTSEYRVDYIVLVQSGSDRRIVIPVFQEKTVVSSEWKVYYSYLDCSSVLLTGGTKTLNIVYAEETTYLDKSIEYQFYSGKDIEVNIKTVSGSGKAVASYNESSEKWTITFPEVKSRTEYEIYTSYQGVNSAVYEISQESALISSDYIFCVEDFTQVADDRDLEVLPSYSGNNEIPVEPNAGTVTVTLVSKKTNHYADGSSKTVTVPFKAKSKSSYVFIDSNSISTETGKLIFKVKANLGGIRYDSLRLIQEESEKSLDINVVQKKSTSYFKVRIKIPKEHPDDVYVPGLDPSYYVYEYQYKGTYDMNKEMFPFVGVAFPEKFALGNKKTSLEFYVEMISVLNWVEQEFDTSSEDVYMYTIPDSGWLTVNIDPTQERRYNHIQVDLSENTGGSEREYYFSLTPYFGENCITFKLLQTKGEPYIYIDGDTGDSTYVLETTKHSQTIYVSIESNCPYTITNNSSWITVSSKTQPAGSTKLGLSLEENKSELERSFDLYLTGENESIKRTLRVTQTTGGNYINVVDFGGEDLMVTLSDWKNLLVIPIESNCPYFIDYYTSTYFRAVLNEKGTYTTFPEPSYADDHTVLEATEGTNYLYITSKSGVNVRGVISLSYYDSETQQIVRGRNIYVYYYPELDVLPYGAKNTFVYGEGQTLDLYAYTKDLSDLRIYLNTSNCSEDFLKKFNPEDFVVKNPKSTGKLNKLTVTIPSNLTTSYQKAEFTLGTSDSEIDYISEMTNHKLPAYSLYQYPEVSFDCYYGNPGVKTIEVSSEGSNSLSIQAALTDSLGFWELSEESLPGWISIKDNISAGSEESIDLVVEPNYTTESRSSSVSFWCDSNKNTLKTITINQEGAVTKVSGYTNDYSLITASTSSRYVLLYNVSSVTSTKTVESGGIVRSSDDSIFTEVSDYNNALKVSYSILNANTYYHKDIYKVLELELKDGTKRQFIIKNPRSQEISISITNSVNSYMDSNEFTYATNAFAISSNIGLTGFRRETTDTFKTTYLDSPTSNILDGAYSNQFLNPSKLFYKSQVMDKLMIKNMDILPGYTYNQPVILPKKTSGKNRGIVIYNEYDVPYSSLDTVTDYSYDVTLSSTVGNTTRLSVKAYDGLNISTSGSGFNISYEQSELTKEVGSLGRLYIAIDPTSDNNTAAKKYLGYVKVVTSSGVTRTLYIYQDTSIYSPVGITSLYTAGNGVILVNAGDSSGIKNANIVYNETSTSWDVEFVHKYPNWMLLNVSGEENPGIKFNGSIYSSDFGNGGNSGTATSILEEKILDCEYKTSLQLASSKEFPTDNASFELSRIAKYGIISTYTTGNINLPENAKSYIDIYTRPNLPFFTVLTDNGVKIKDSEGNTGSGTLVSKRHQSNPGSTTNPGTIWFPVNFEITSNYIDICKNYIGKTIVKDGKDFTISNMFDVFLDRLHSLQIKYVIGGVESSIYLDKTKGTTNETGGYVYFTQGQNDASRVIKVSDLSTIPESGTLVIWMQDFQIDSQKYYPQQSMRKIEIPIKFEI